MTIPDNPIIKDQIIEMKENGIYVSDISKILSDQNNIKITQIDIWRFLKNYKPVQKEIEDYDYPARDEIENIFSKLLQKEKNIAFKFHNINIRRNLMIRILNTYHNKVFSYNEIRVNLNDRYNEDSLYQHFEYLKINNFIIKVNNDKFKFCDRVRKWKNFGQI